MELYKYFFFNKLPTIFVQMWVKSRDLDENKAIFVQMWVKNRDLDKNTTEGWKN